MLTPGDGNCPAQLTMFTKQFFIIIYVVVYYYTFEPSIAPKIALRLVDGSTTALRFASSIFTS